MAHSLKCNKAEMKMAVAVRGETLRFNGISKAVFPHLSCCIAQNGYAAL
jgi:hypothetical protein